MSIKKDTIIVIKSINFSESDKILIVYGKNFGKYTIFAKGVRKIESKNRGSIQTLSISRISFFVGTGMGTLIEAESVFISELDPQTLHNIERILKIINKLIQEDEPNQKIFDSLSKLIMNGFETNTVNRLRVSILNELGYIPDYRVCSICNKKGNLVAINPDSLGFICSKCSQEVSNSLIVQIKNERGETDTLKITECIDKFENKLLE